MEEIVALDTSKQKKFVKSIKGIQKLIHKAGKGDIPDNVVLKSKDAKKSKRRRPERGLVYLSHIPHGFYEHEMSQYFRQFGAVSNVRVIRSKRTGNSKGFAFVEFKLPAVAEIVAETMNNYLMGKRLIKAAYIPPEKQRPRAMRKHWSRLNNPGVNERLKQKKAHNQNKDDQGELVKARRTMKNFNNNMKKLSELGINYDFFTPVDIPEGINTGTNVQNTVQDKSDNKKNKNIAVKDEESKSQKTDKSVKETLKAVKETNVEKKAEKKEKKNKPEPVVNKKEQNKKQQKLKDAGVKPPENFIKLQEESEDSDSSADFDSDEYRKMLENDSDADSGEESDDGESGEDGESDDDLEGEEESENDEEEFEITGSEDDDSDVAESEDEEVLPPPKKGKQGSALPQAVQTKKQATQKVAVAQKQKGPIDPKQKGPIDSKQKGPIDPKQKGPIAPKMKGPIAPVQKGPKVPQKEQQSPEQIKRKAPQKNAVSPKKPKFEKQTQQPMKKQFKKKK